MFQNYSPVCFDKLLLDLFSQELNSLEPHENFRLWLTAESHPKFPTILLQSSLKVTYEVSLIFFQLKSPNEVIQNIEKTLNNIHTITQRPTTTIITAIPRNTKKLTSFLSHTVCVYFCNFEWIKKLTYCLTRRCLFSFQAPPGIKKNLQRTYDSWSPQFISRGNSSIRAQALFVLAWFHAIVQERRNYIPQVSCEIYLKTYT